MSETSGSSGNVTPKHLWVIGIVALLWDSLGAFDFVMTQTENERYLADFPPEQREFFQFPWLIDFAWALAVFGGLLGSVLLLARRAQAVRFYAGSLAGFLVTVIHNYGFANGLEVLGNAGLAFTAGIFAVSVALLAYARAMARAGVLT